MSDETECDAYRAAGQAVAAMLHGSPVQRIGVEGVDMAWGDEPDYERSRADLLADIAIGLAGVAAVSAYGFGSLSREDRSTLVFHSFYDSQVDDLAEVMKLVEIIDPDAGRDVYFQSFQQAFDLIAEPLAWAAIETLAAAIQEREVSVRELYTMVLEGEPKSIAPSDQTIVDVV